MQKRLQEESTGQEPNSVCKWRAHARVIRDAPAGLLLEAVKILASELGITIDKEAAKRLGERIYVDNTILGGMQGDVAMKRRALANPTL